MLALTHTRKTGTNTSSRYLLPLILATGLLLLAACGSGNTAGGDSDVSHAGQVAYACTLADHVDHEHGDIAAWKNLIGDEANPGARELASISMLLLAADDGAFDTEDQPAGVGIQLADSSRRADIAGLETGLQHVIDGCQNIESVETAEASHDAQLEYACTLADRVSTEYGDAASWEGIEESPAWYEAASAAALTGAMNGQVLAEHAELSEMGQHIMMAVSRLDAEQVDEGLAAFQSACGTQ